MSNDSLLPEQGPAGGAPAPDVAPTPELAEGRVRYAPARDGGNGMATAALVVGLLAVILIPAALVGSAVGCVAIMLGLIALGRAQQLLPNQGRRGQAIVGTGLGALGVALGMLLYSMTYTPTIPKRAVCASNIRGIGQALKVYANDNLDSYPATLYAPVPDDGGISTRVSFVGRMGAEYRTDLDTLPPGVTAGQTDDLAKRSYADPNTPGLAAKRNSVHPSRSLFILVMDGTCTAEQFICPASGDQADDLRDPHASKLASAPGYSRFDFKGYPHLSYGYQLPYGQYGRPSEDLDGNMPIMADKGPYYTAGTRRADGTIPDRPTVTPGSPLTVAGMTTAEVARRSESETWRPYNSRNHAREGQNVLYNDCHASFEKKPIVGIDNDNIYTMQGPGATPLDVIFGLVPADRQGPRTNTDSVIVP